jgi:hypothetical protein
MKVVENLEELYNLASTSEFSPSDPYYRTILTGDIVYVRGYINDEDGGGGFFIFEGTSDLEPFYQDFAPYENNPNIAYQTFEEMLKIGYNTNYDGMVCKSGVSTNGIWKRQWDRGKLNLRWFGARPSGIDISPAINAALKYAQFEIPVKFEITVPNTDPVQSYGPPQYGYVPELTTFNATAYTRPGKTIFIPSGRYYAKSFISTIYYGVVFEGEGNMGTSAHGTRLLIAHGYKDFNFLLDENDLNSGILPVGDEKGAFFRYVANGTNNSGGGLKNLAIIVTEVDNHVDSPVVNAFDANIVSLISPLVTPPANELDCPPVSKWTAENVIFTLNARAKRAIIMESNQVGGSNIIWRIRDISLISCWFSGASKEGETIRATQTSGLHIIGGLIKSGLGSVNPDDASLPPDRVKPGIFLDHCANVHLNGVDLTHGEIFIYKKSRFINIDCRFGRLLIYDSVGKEHIDLQVSKKYILNPRTETPDYLDCVNAPNGYMCFNNAHEIDDEVSDTDNDIIWLHSPPI